MRLITIDDIEAAAVRVAGRAVRTPLVPSLWAPEDRPLWLKPEQLQPIGAFKLRGAVNAIARIPDDVREKGVVAYSSGNHAQAVAYTAKLYGVPATIVVTTNTPQVKIDATARHGAKVVVVPPADRESAAEEIVATQGGTMVPPFDHPDVIAGQGTIGLEIAADLPDVEVVLVPVSGGGLISGIATAIRAKAPNAKVIGVEPELAGDTAEGFRLGRRPDWSTDDRARTIADGLRSTPSELTFAHITKLVDDVVTVTEDQIRDAIAVLAVRSQQVAEPSGAVTTAAYLHADLPRGRTVALVSGGNIDPALLAEVLTRQQV
ncbi:threonine ammonia-lyase [Actinophytocola oryzae]|uniref:threonine ammonia-lyase n=1 Tax=Actinophytocola oryzae TaxID=502181 RepID=A0A4R7UW97_9PSEU|nr:threonine/serine dehydratase [Actinophytocola oryzae]TDV40780.1 threonine dehydratase [Actinophytocola oryzae]